MYGTGTRLGSTKMDTVKSHTASKARDMFTSSRKGLTRNDSHDELPLEIWQQTNVEVRHDQDHDLEAQDPTGLKQYMNTHVVAAAGSHASSSDDGESLPEKDRTVPRTSL